MILFIFKLHTMQLKWKKIKNKKHTQARNLSSADHVLGGTGSKTVCFAQTQRAGLGLRIKCE